MSSVCNKQPDDDGNAFCNFEIILLRPMTPYFRNSSVQLFLSRINFTKNIF